MPKAWKLQEKARTFLGCDLLKHFADKDARRRNHFSLDGEIRALDGQMYWEFLFVSSVQQVGCLFHFLWWRHGHLTIKPKDILVIQREELKKFLLKSKGGNNKLMPPSRCHKVNEKCGRKKLEFYSL